MRYNSGEGAWIPCLLEEKHSFDDCDIILLSPRSSVDRAVASGAMRAGSIPVGDAFPNYILSMSGRRGLLGLLGPHRFQAFRSLPCEAQEEEIDNTVNT